MIDVAGIVIRKTGRPVESYGVMGVKFHPYLHWISDLSHRFRPARQDPWSNERFERLLTARELDKVRREYG